MDALTLPVSPDTSQTVVHEVGYQSWTKDNLWVLSEHENIEYFTTRWDALCPYIEVTNEMIEMAPKPFVVYAVPPKSQFGAPIKDRYGLVNALSPEFWVDERRIRKFRELDKQFRSFKVTERVVDGKEITAEYLYEIGGIHFENYWIAEQEVEGFVDYVRNLQVLIIQVIADNGDIVLSDVSIILPNENQLYGSFCQWDRKYKNRSPGIYACLLATRWAQKNGLQFYNLGPVDEYGYKDLFITDYEPIYALIVSDLDHPIVTDQTSPINIDFEKEQINQIYRNKSAL
ncbi:hypothetical protein [Polynucleobacter sp. UB-Piko-W3]|uniref:hypothetical protein n=1 Tax=Polynucleobacter sp. UB-Piko-W3 TaxID=1819735 RepID=UPI001C0D4112|nr:hypothetical protein [Polynucleobacter sp. UB-Piko-W3]MBU3554707.1 hypothetical protein [Polynucleobacter sp. UB-Piko-W3]